MKPGEIRILSDETVNKVAAGEVVERPAAALKELVENSIDAGASRVDVKVEGAGRRIIRVTDDGRGMSHDDLLLALERHSTSKITDAADLDSVTSFGFRGEALPSIAAVSRMQIVSRPADGQEGTRVDIVSGRITRVAPCGAPAGTLVEVRSLFRNVPARLKFLRTDTTELAHCVSAVSQLALANPPIAFSLESGSRSILRLAAAGSEGERLQAYGGRDFFATLRPFRAAGGDVKISGFVARPGQGKRGGDYQSLFVNGRPVRDFILSKALREAWRDYAVGGKDPLTYFVWLEIPPAMVDVNVHPTKREVRFRQVSPLASLLTGALHEALRGGRSQSFRPLPPLRTPAASEGSTPYRRVDKAEQLPLNAGGASGRDSVGTAGAVLQLFATYLVMTDEEGVLLVDQHAAHERVLYEKVLKNFKAGRTQQLLHPVLLDVTAAEAGILEELAPALAGYGIAVEAFGPRSFRLSALPLDLGAKEAEHFIREIIDGVTAGSPPPDLPDWLRERAALAACHASVRASQKMSPLQVRELLKDLFACRDPAHCPHGRPTYLRIDRREIEKRFRRVP